MNYITNITSKGQITVNKAVREGLGLKPGDPVEIEFDGSGKAAFRKADEASRIATQRADLRKKIKVAQVAFRNQDPFPDMSNEEWFDWVRGPAAEV
jgi:AbrB family looped-hinge helix DNA binding protein